jgi:hypothetical protein
MTKLQRVQNKASRLIFGRNCTHELDNRLLSAKHILEYTDLLYLFKCRNGLIDCDMTKDIRVGRLIRGDEIIVHRLIPPRARTSLYQSGFVIRSVNLWNNLPSNVKLSELAHFKNNLRSHLHSTYSITYIPFIPLPLHIPSTQFGTMPQANICVQCLSTLYTFLNRTLMYHMYW